MARRALLRLALIAFAFVIPSLCGAASDEETLRRMTQELLDAVAPGRADVWDRHLAENMIHVDENGVVRSKAELLKELRPLPAGLVGNIKIDSFRVAIHGDVAVVAHEDQEQLDYHGQMLRSRFRSLDTWRRTSQGWQLVGQHAAAVLKDPPTRTLSDEELCAYNGNYSLTREISTTIRCSEGGLLAQRAGRPELKFVAELPDVFFAPGQARSRRIFLRDTQRKIIGFVDRREGEDVRWTKTP